jgi:hypothetical protein
MSTVITNYRYIYIVMTCNDIIGGKNYDAHTRHPTKVYYAVNLHGNAKDVT